VKKATAEAMLDKVLGRMDGARDQEFGTEEMVNLSQVAKNLASTLETMLYTEDVLEMRALKNAGKLGRHGDN